jgi:hypothetical protein
LSYWRGYIKPNVQQVSLATNESNREESISSNVCEDEPTDKELGVQLKNVSKVNNSTEKIITNIYVFSFILVRIDLFISFPKSSTCSCCTES